MLFSEPNTPAPAAKTPAGGTSSFKDFRDAAIQELSQPAEKQASGKTAEKSGQDVQDAEKAKDKDEKEVSKCGDSGMNALLSGIVGILEGFGLLTETNGNMNENGNAAAANAVITVAEGTQSAPVNAASTKDLLAGLPATAATTAEEAAVQPGQAAATTQTASAGVVKTGQAAPQATAPQTTTAAPQTVTAVQDSAPAAQNAQAPADDETTAKINQLFSEMIARMPQDDQDAQQAAKAQISALVKEYLSSFGNVNHQGAEKATPAPAQNGQAAEAKAPQSALEQLLTALQGAAEQNGVKKSVDTSTAGQQDKTGSQDAQKDTGRPVLTLIKSDTATHVQPKAAEKLPEGAKAMQENLAQLADKFTASVRNGGSEFEVALKPESLGKLSIKLTMDSDGIKAHIKAADSSVKNLITEQLPALQETLKEKGVTLTNIEVSYERSQFDQGQSRNFNGQNGGNKKNYRSMTAALGGVTYETMSDTAELIVRNSSVEFRA